MKIVRIIEVATLRQLTLQPGDEIHTKNLTPELRALCEAQRIDGKHVAAIVDDDEYAVIDSGETAVSRGRRNRTVQ
jgi:hypothetical protein